MLVQIDYSDRDLRVELKFSNTNVMINKCTRKTIPSGTARNDQLQNISRDQ